MKMIKFIELFCGIGGFRLGLEKANTPKQESGEIEQTPPSTSGERNGRGFQPIYRCVWSNDNDKYACQIYRKHFGEIYEGDIRTIDTATIPEHDLLCAGFPCQSFSIAGKRRGFEDTRGTLFFEICRVLRAKRPSYLLLENVRGLLSHDDGRTFGIILASLDELGYDLQWQVLNSKNFGVPQNRERVFIIGHLRGKPRPKVFPIGETGGTDKELNFLYGAISKDVSMWLDNGKKFSRNYPQGQRVYDSKGISAQLNAEAGGWGAKTGLYAIYDLYNKGLRANQELAGSLKGEGIADTSIGTALIEKHKVRRLTPLECERLQGFPDRWTEKGVDTSGNEVSISDTQRYKVLGNAVTVSVITQIGLQLLQSLCYNIDEV